MADNSLITTAQYNLCY